MVVSDNLVCFFILQSKISFLLLNLQEFIIKLGLIRQSKERQRWNILNFFCNLYKIDIKIPIYLK